MTTAEQFRSAISHPTGREVVIAGVAWPAYKLVALLVGVVVFGLVAVFTASAGPAVLTAAAATTIVWQGLGLRRRGE